MKKRSQLFRDTKGDAVVEATILFPIIIMIFAGLVLLAVYLPTRANLQRATQYAATAMATQKSDSWLTYDESSMEYAWASKNTLGKRKNVYAALFSSFASGSGAESAQAETIVKNMEQQSFISGDGELTIDYGVVNYVIYKEVLVTATKALKLPVNLSLLGLPNTLEITVTSTAVVTNGDEFVRSIDIAADFVGFLAKKYEGTTVVQAFQSIGTVCEKINGFLGI